MTDYTDEEYWEKIGRENPYWGVLSQDRFRGTNIDASLKADFMAEGERDIAFALAMVNRYTDGEFKPKSALDFGCGVGRLVTAMANHAERVTGVDVSPAMLTRAQADAQTRGLASVRFVSEIPAETFDWINSFIVFQHIEPRKGIALLDELLSRLEVGGVVTLHFTIFRDSRVWHRGLQEAEFGRYDGEVFVNYSRGPIRDMPIYEYDLSEVVCHMVGHGLQALSMRHTDHGGLHGMWIVGKRE
jgi:2-polyprenyl-3-methyl-5-hydroxy-6-metoxy-1,4-benzoquinol methylase